MTTISMVLVVCVLAFLTELATVLWLARKEK